MNDYPNQNGFLVTKEHRRFVEFCDACRRYRYIGLCYGPAGVGKTLSSRVYAGWEWVERLDGVALRAMPPVSEILGGRTLFYTAPVHATPQRIEREIEALRARFNKLLVEMDWVVQDVDIYTYPLNSPDRVELILVDEADRLSATGLEQIRDIYDRSQIGVVLIGMPGIEKRLSRYPQLYSRVGFVHHFKPLSSDEVQFVLRHKWQQLGLSLDPTDYTDAEAVAAIVRITGGNFRLLQRLLSQVERVMQINELQCMTKEVVETSRELLILG